MPVGLFLFQTREEEEMRNRDKIIIRFVGIDEWCRAVFREVDENRRFKSVKFVPDQFHRMMGSA